MKHPTLAFVFVKHGVVHHGFQLQRQLVDGSHWGIQLSFITQPEPAGLDQAYILAEEFLAGASLAIVLGDNVFFGHSLTEVFTQT